MSAVVYSTERDRAPLEVIRTALHDVARVATVYEALDVAVDALRRLDELARAEAIRHA